MSCTIGGIAGLVTSLASEQSDARSSKKFVLPHTEDMPMTPSIQVKRAGGLVYLLVAEKDEEMSTT
jgi:hypothetical protein